MALLEKEKGIPMDYMIEQIEKAIKTACKNSKSKAYGVLIEINGGEISVSVGNGDTDAIDSNGDITVNGGTVSVTTPGSSFDYDGKATYNGGTIIINGVEVNAIPQSMMPGMMGGRR